MRIVIAAIMSMFVGVVVAYLLRASFTIDGRLHSLIVCAVAVVVLFLANAAGFFKEGE